MMRKAFSNYNLLHSLRSASSFSPTIQTSVSQRLFGTAEEAESDHEELMDNAVIDWDNIGFSLIPTDYMYTMKCSTLDNDNGITFTDGQLSNYGNLQISPAAGVLNYGQGLFEGLKAYRRENGKIALFRPDQNAMRMRIGAERMCMPSPSIDQFINAVKQTTVANNRWIPPREKGALYLRPLLLGTGPVLGLAPAPDYSFLVYASPVGNYFKDAKTLNLYVETEYDRASRGGAGGVKSITNYAPGMMPALRAKSKGFSDVLYLDSATGKYIEEVSSCNIFLVKDGVISTPVTNGTILPGITRKSIIEIAMDQGFQVKERMIPVDELEEADEVFCTGTAVVVSSVGTITYKGQRIVYQTGKHSVYERLSSRLLGIQSGVLQDNKGWIVEI